ncbi:hypothetical protein COEREDRAFT_89456 [Coemansia reversa NRRL 1564]|uniref:Uncharacterized protein n=1 Tax=Coemansia reversa (strain ATCC 12441 / NRRL 1564) TaxID=763665 RepID=A0A2G5B3J8_COERN|nr:hypothetical protein COEREDRAFT_89456 [Coemansia reversa NRRL 1564]|eukprot:PIA13592.1 hypothetical protein COEREDRAFT_89456 [Coemansia reversa NRRL 1564]
MLEELGGMIPKMVMACNDNAAVYVHSKNFDITLEGFYQDCASNGLCGIKTENNSRTSTIELRYGFVECSPNTGTIKEKLEEMKVQYAGNVVYVNNDMFDVSSAIDNGSDSEKSVNISLACCGNGLFSQITQPMTVASTWW